MKILLFLTLWHLLGRALPSQAWHKGESRWHAGLEAWRLDWRISSQMQRGFTLPSRHCTLCEKKSEILFETQVSLLTQGPFAHVWPGAMMLISKRHVEEASDLRPNQMREMFLDLCDAEKAVRKITACARINLSKFGNITPHLHWHIIPRYVEEAHRLLTPWEVLQKLMHQGLDPNPQAPVLQPQMRPQAQGLLLPSAQLYSRLSEQFAFERQHRVNSTFSAALFLRPKDKERRQEAELWPLEKISREAQSRSEEWESLLMQRNYLDRAWDHFGGNADAHEFPADTLVREVREETGWQIAECLEVNRQWTGGQLRGVLFLARPQISAPGNLPFWMENNPSRSPCDEVAQVGWWCLKSLAKGEVSVKLGFGVRERHQAFLDKKTDFRCE
jgi:diadenosine tetraphosphate (Ap4A) HIT family hydrolase/8-oxo-dGTP pyrophosphatase MutT (NUDIX family)